MDTVFQTVEEAVELSEDKTIKLVLKLTCGRYNDDGDTPITFNSNIDDEAGAIILAPADPYVSILEASVANASTTDHIENNSDGTITIFYSLDIHMIAEDLEMGYEVAVSVDDIGQAVIIPAMETSQFISAVHSEDDQIDLITEETKIEDSDTNTSEPQEDKETEAETTEETSEDAKEEIPDVEARVVNESVEVVESPITEGEPYDKETIESILAEITDNFSAPNGVVKCGFFEERDLAAEILTANNYYMDIVPNGDWYIISYAKLKEASEQEFQTELGDIVNDSEEELTESKAGTLDENKELAIAVLEDIQKLVSQLALKAEKLSEYYDLLNLNLEKVENFRSIVASLEQNSFDNVSVEGLRDDLQRGFL